MTIECVECKRMDLRSAPAMTQHGFGVCTARGPWQFVSPLYQRTCSQFVAADWPTVSARREWIDRKATLRNLGDGAPEKAAPCNTSNTNTKSL
jgi:hypothetical protein